ncbi:MAG: glutathione synthase [Methyloversatilis sp.]|uniref:glutathione synthase n=2 Tax=Methyloversatilis sp. TaxID=2569862 RepID=UPI002734844F|nr:glutathione synthase [Methyloversatilis sp.]MDP2869855.1 glutathione synthase [Methyloversatilis sp.]MDP3457304.1 glutathione synthase [Methyloversatilis sp.]MDP3576696.1 glutathione synthase [Methyloversatilis sp.]
MIMQFAFIVDPLDALKPVKDSSIAMMREAARRGHEIWTVQRGALSLSGSELSASALRIDLAQGDQPWYSPAGAEMRALRDFDAVLMRQDPPFDFEYITATWMLERAVAGGARVFNHPRAVRDHSEKVSICEFPDLITPTLVTRDVAAINAFIDLHRDSILKPLDGMGGSRIFRVRADDPNRNVIIETLTGDGGDTLMAQRFIPDIAQGDKRILLIDGEPVPFCLARIPKAGETRGNLAVGGRGVAQPLSEADWRIARALGPVLAARGLLLVGLDVIGDRLTEINVTSPTCFVEITEQTGFDVAAMFVDALERAATR